MLGLAGEAAAQHLPHHDVRAMWGWQLVPVRADGCPVQPADASIASLAAQCADFHREARKAPRKYRGQLADIAKDCDAKYAELYLSLLQSKYSRADFAAVVNRITSGGGDATRLECELAASHNERLNTEIDRRQAEWDALEREHNARVDENDAEIARLQAELAHPAPPPSPSTLQVLGTVLQGMGQGLASTRTTAPPPSRSGCTSDYECPYGSGCVKAPMASEGYCAQKVNSYGTPTYSPPAPSSVQLGGRGQCGFDTDCPVDFYCAVQPGALRGACLKR